MKISRIWNYSPVIKSRFLLLFFVACYIKAYIPYFKQITNLNYYSNYLILIQNI